MPCRRSKAATILVVDDDLSIRNAFRRLLELEGYRVEVAEDADEALAACQRLGNRVDLAILDVVMPKVRGPELAIQLKRRGIDCPILYVSGHPPEDIPASDRLSDYLPKPVCHRLLLERVAEILAAKEG